MALDYQFENLGEDRFQHLCQALLIPEFSNVQCFPIRQPDGGRDAVSAYWATLESPFIVFQVKYVRRPLAESEPWKWFVKTIETELPKIQKLIPEGAEQYILMTNVPATAHPGSGSIDKVNTFLRSTIPIPSQCWWRDDLSRRLDNQPDLRWSFSELITGPDLLRTTSRIWSYKIICSGGCLQSKHTFPINSSRIRRFVSNKSNYRITY